LSTRRFRSKVKRWEENRVVEEAGKEGRFKIAEEDCHPQSYHMNGMICFTFDI
jgi:hypothetical protein